MSLIFADFVVVSPGGLPIRFVFCIKYFLSNSKIDLSKLFRIENRGIEDSRRGSSL